MDTYCLYYTSSDTYVLYVYYVCTCKAVKQYSRCHVHEEMLSSYHEIESKMPQTIDLLCETITLRQRQQQSDPDHHNQNSG